MLCTINRTTMQLVTMPVSVKYFAPKVTVKLCTCIIDFSSFEITVVKIMNNLFICSADSYLYPRSRFKGLYCKTYIPCQGIKLIEI